MVISYTDEELANDEFILPRGVTGMVLRVYLLMNHLTKQV